MQNLKILWLREDLRTEDNDAFINIAKNTEKFEVFYAYDELKFKFRSAQRWWLYKSLQKLEDKLSNAGI